MCKTVNRNALGTIWGLSRETADGKIFKQNNENIHTSSEGYSINQAKGKPGLISLSRRCVLIGQSTSLPSGLQQTLLIYPSYI